MTSYPLEQVGRAPASSAGVATVTMGPVPPFKSWNIGRVAVQSTSVDRTAAVVYRNSALSSNIIDNSAPYSGNDDTSDTGFLLQAGESLVVQWTGSTAGAICTVTVSGTLEAP